MVAKQRLASGSSTKRQRCSAGWRLGTVGGLEYETNAVGHSAVRSTEWSMRLEPRDRDNRFVSRELSPQKRFKCLGITPDDFFPLQLQSADEVGVRQRLRNSCI